MVLRFSLGEADTSPLLKQNKMEENIMEQQLIRCFKNLVSALLSDETNIETMVDNFLHNSELVISPAAREELVRYIYNEIDLAGLPQ